MKEEIEEMNTLNDHKRALACGVDIRQKRWFGMQPGREDNTTFHLLHALHLHGVTQVVTPLIIILYV